MLFAQNPIVRRYTLAIHRSLARLRLIDQVTYKQCVRLVGTENQCFLVLIDLVHKDFDTLFFAFADLDASIEVRFLIDFSSLDFTLYHRIIRRVNVVIKRRLDLLDLEWRQEAIVNAVLE